MSDVVEFEDLVASRGTVLLRFTFMLCGDAHMAEDLLQTVLVRAFRRWDRITGAEQPEAYLKKMLVNEYLSWRRRSASREVPMPPALEGSAISADDSAGHASRDAAWALLARLPRRQRAVLVLRFYEDLSNDQIAELLGCSPGTVRSNAARAVATLRGVIPTLDPEVLP